MHNLHLIRTKADSHSDALSIVEDFLQSWGTENNWSTVLGSHCKEDKSFSESFDEPRCFPKTDRPPVESDPAIR